MIILSANTPFPSVEQADEDGIIAFGGDLSTERLLTAYKQGIFPWYNDDEPIVWWSPNPRCVLFPEKIKISKSMNVLIRSGKFTFTINKAFGSVIEHCKSTPRTKQSGTWINDDIIAAYTTLHNLGFAVSAETWQNNELVGGLYGVKIGKVFFGESMFSKVPNASKFAFIQFVQQLKKEGTKLIDCQVHTKHLESLGAELISRKVFCNLLKQYV